MARLVFGPLVVLLCAGKIPAQNVAAIWFPTHRGDAWTYQHETRDDSGQGRAHPEIHRWKTEETLLSSVALPEGTLIGKRVRVFDGSPPPHREPRTEEAYLLGKDCIYTKNVGWYPLRHKLAPEFLGWLSAGTISPDFCFPLEAGKTWGAPHWGQRSAADAKDWQVSEIVERDQSAPGRRPAFHVKSISSYPGSGLAVDIWFARGVGVTRELQVHNGTYGEERTTLIEFDPAPR